MRPHMGAFVAEQVANYMASNYGKMMSGRGYGGKGPTKRLKQTQMVQRTPNRGTKRGRGGAGSKNSPSRHERLRTATGRRPNMGRGFNRRPNGVIVANPRVPKWKMERLKKYNETVWQTVLVSRSNRLPNSNNVLETCRYPIKAPECLDGERVQTMMFMPFCSHYSGVHTTYYQKVRADGTDLEHATGPNERLDVIQRKADTAAHMSTRGKIENQNAVPPLYETDGTTAAGATSLTNYKSVKDNMDQVVRQVDVDLVFTASRAFPVVVSVSVVRFLQPTVPYVLTDDMKRQLCNGIDNKGMEWTHFKTEWHTEFTLPALRVNKKPATRSVNKKLLTNWMQTNAFNEKNTAQELLEANNNKLGMSLHTQHNEIADGQASGQFVVLIKYRKKQQPQQFTYTQTIEADSDATSARFPSATVTLPVVTEESFDVPTHDGIAAADSSGDQFETGAPLTTNQGDESKASFYVHGKLGYMWGFRHEVESIPSVMTNNTTQANYKKSQSLNIDPSYPQGAGDVTTYGIYTRSQDHQNVT